MDSLRVIKIRLGNRGYKIRRVSTYLYLWDTLRGDKECGYHADRETWNSTRISQNPKFQMLGLKAEINLIFTLLPLVMRDPNMTNDAKAILMLCGRFHKGDSPEMATIRINLEEQTMIKDGE